jgi:uncharacterized SAM-binding protein YcdF (DUF218 family)
LRTKKSGFFFKQRKLLLMLLLAILLALVSVIPIRLAIAFYQAPVPQAIFVLGGKFERTKVGAQVWQFHTNFNIWVSDGSQHLEAHRRILEEFDIPNEQLQLDGRATDTVTNFTSLVGDFATQKLQHLYLVTSDYHMTRSMAIAAIILGSQGIAVTPVTVISDGEEPESLLRVVRDCGRSVLWLVTGRTGASLNPRLNSPGQG